MKELVILQNDEAVTTSLKIAKAFDKRHDHVLRAIDGAVASLPKIGDANKAFQQTTYIDAQGKARPMYYLNRDGFSFVAMGFTGKKAAEWKWKFIQAFNAMESKLLELLKKPQIDPRWAETRLLGKATRKQETGVIKNFIAYSQSQGDTREPSAIYSKLSVLANTTAGMPRRNGRDSATVKQLNICDLTEGIIRNVLLRGMAEGKHFAQIESEVEISVYNFKAITNGDNLLLA